MNTHTNPNHLEEFKTLEEDFSEYLKLMKAGRFNDARLLAHLLVSATYVLDDVWMRATTRGQK
jgi:hypothetical protein